MEEAGAKVGYSITVTRVASKPVTVEEIQEQPDSSRQTARIDGSLPRRAGSPSIFAQIPLPGKAEHANIISIMGPVLTLFAGRISNTAVLWTSRRVFLSTRMVDDERAWDTPASRMGNGRVGDPQPERIGNRSRLEKQPTELQRNPKGFRRRCTSPQKSRQKTEATSSSRARKLLICASSFRSGDSDSFDKMLLRKEKQNHDRGDDYC